VYGSLGELADPLDSKSSAARRIGSNPIGAIDLNSGHEVELDMFTIHLATNSLEHTANPTAEMFQELSHEIYTPQPIGETNSFSFKKSSKIESMYILDNQGRVWYYQNIICLPFQGDSISFTFDNNIGRMFRLAEKGSGNLWLDRATNEG
jgi:hypothetical protein